MVRPMSDKATERLNSPTCWGLPPEAVADLGPRLHRFLERFNGCFKTKTRNAAGPAWIFLQGLLLMKTKRNFANIERRVTQPDKDGQSCNSSCPIRRGGRSRPSAKSNARLYPTAGAKPQNPR